MSRNRKSYKKGSSNNDPKTNSKEKENGSNSNPGTGSSSETKETAAENKDREGGEKDDSRRSEDGKRINDPEWYARDLQLLTDSASLNYSDPLGAKIRLVSHIERIWGGSVLTNQGLYTNIDDAHCFAIPGICTLKMKHTIGFSNNRNSPANNAANALYTFVRYVNSGRKNYDPADLMIYAFSIGDLYSFISWCKRTYAYAFLYSQKNKYIGKALLEECEVNPDDMLSNLANFRYWLNTFISKVASFALPKDVPYFSRRIFMYDGLYLENPYDNLKDQLYQFNPEGFFKFQLDPYNAGMCKWTPLPSRSGGMLATDIMTYGNALLANIMGDEDFGLMSGDILKAYDSNIFTLTGLEAEYFVLPHYDLYVLSQFKNATIVGDAVRTNNNSAGVQYKSPNESSSHVYDFGDIMQDTVGNIVCREGIVCTQASTDELGRQVGAFMSKILSLEVPNPTPADNIEATRCMIASTRGQNADVVVASGTAPEMLYLITGVDFPVAATMRSNLFTNAHGVNPSRLTITGSLLAGTSASLNNVSTADHFKYSPIIYTGSLTNAGVGYEVTSVISRSNVDNYTVVDYNALNKMHECALLSLFFVPGVAKLVNFLK